MKVIKQHKWLFVIMAFLFVIALLVLSCFQSRYSLTCTLYSIHTGKIEEPVRVLQITDLHNSTFGEDNRKLVDLAASQSPDLILITGDLLNSDESETDIAVKLISDLCSHAPVYVSMGNHELEYQQVYGVDIAQLYEAAGAVVLEKQYEDITVNGQQIRLGGIYGYCVPAKYLETKEANPEECAFLADFQNTDLFTVLMCHMPVCWILNGGLDEWDVDCVFSGHVHGGQMILPVVGGVYAPDMGWFPGRLQGLFYSEDHTRTLVLSRGLGNTESVPRINNIPEVVVVDVLPE